MEAEAQAPSSSEQNILHNQQFVTEIREQMLRFAKLQLMTDL